jgi:hypothetical protein
MRKHHSSDGGTKLYCRRFLRRGSCTARGLLKMRIAGASGACPGWRRGRVRTSLALSASHGLLRKRSAGLLNAQNLASSCEKRAVGGGRCAPEFPAAKLTRRSAARRLANSPYKTVPNIGELRPGIVRGFMAMTGDPGCPDLHSIRRESNHVGLVARCKAS